MRKNIRIYNSMSGRKEPLPVPEGKPIRMFVCGPTVYDYMHIGNARTYIAFDAWARYLRSSGYRLFYLQNITDIDDKIIARAAEEGITPREIAVRFLEAYRDSTRALEINSVDIYAPATKYIPEVISQIDILLRKEYGYIIEHDGIYFDISKFMDYGKLARRTASQAEDSLSRIDQSVRKRNKGDFCLWKFSAPGEPSWNASFGKGRPGWHIEDTAITQKFFGPQYEIHGGGIDIKFPHHEAEIAQQESASGLKPFVKVWMHTGSLSAGGRKMSKSLGNYVSIDDYLGRYSPQSMRLLFLGHHYRMPIDYRGEDARNSQAAWARLREFMGKLEFAAKHSSSSEPKHPAPICGLFDKALADDFNTPLAIAELFKAISRTENRIWTLGSAEAGQIMDELARNFEILGFSFPRVKFPAEIKKLAKERLKARAGRDFKKSDLIRKRIGELGFKADDTPLGQFIWEIEPAPKK